MSRDPATKLDRLRPLGAVETAMAVQHEQRGTTQTASLVQLRGRLSAPLLANVAAQLQARHPLLQAQIAEHDGVLYFIQPASLPAVTLRHTIQEQAGQWPAELERELNEAKGIIGRQCAPQVAELQSRFAKKNQEATAKEADALSAIAQLTQCTHTAEFDRGVIEGGTTSRVGADDEFMSVRDGPGDVRP